jgi:hypothetical protein
MRWHVVTFNCDYVTLELLNFELDDAEKFSHRFAPVSYEAIWDGSFWWCITRLEQLIDMFTNYQWCECGVPIGREISKEILIFGKGAVMRFWVLWFCCINVCETDEGWQQLTNVYACSSETADAQVNFSRWVADCYCYCFLREAEGHRVRPSGRNRAFLLEYG